MRARRRPFLNKLRRTHTYLPQSTIALLHPSQTYSDRVGLILLRPINPSPCITPDITRRFLLRTRQTVMVILPERTATATGQRQRAQIRGIPDMAIRGGIRTLRRSGRFSNPSIIRLLVGLFDTLCVISFEVSMFFISPDARPSARRPGHSGNQRRFSVPQNVYERSWHIMF